MKTKKNLGMIKRLLLITFSTNLFLFGICSSSIAQATITWDGSESSDWNTAANWDTNLVPTDVDSVIIGNGANNLVIDEAGNECRGLTVTANGILTIADGGDIAIKQLVGGVIIQANGTLNITGGIMEVTDDFRTAEDCSINISSGMLKIYDDWAGEDNGTADGNVTITGGDIDVTETCRFDDDNTFSGDFSGNYTLTVGNNFEVSNTSCSITGGTIILTTEGTGGSSVTFESASNKTAEVYNLIISANVARTVKLQSEDGGNIIVKGDFSIISGTAELIGESAGGNPHYLEVRGDVDFTNGTFDPNGGELVLGGNSDQDFTSDFQEVYHFTVNKSAGIVYFNDDVTVTNELELIDGIVNTSGSNLVINDGATVSNVSNDSYIDGFVKKVGNDAFTFPVGANGKYRPISISAPSLDDDEFTATYIADDPDKSYDATSKDGTINNISVLEYWELSRDKGSSNVSVSLSWDGSSAVGVPAELIVARWDGSQWKDHGNTGTTGGANSGTITSEVITSFSPFTLGSTTANNVLPIDLISFDAKLDGDLVKLSWETASEINNDYFTLERSVDAVSWEEFKTIKGSGNSNQILSYKDYDYTPYLGTSYYRLKQTDFDGTYSYSEIQTILNFTSNLIKPVIVANPIPQGANVKIMMRDILDREIVIYNSLGNRVSSEIISQNDQLYLATRHLPKGTYILSLNSNNEQITQKVIVH